MRYSKLLAAGLAVATAAWILSASIAVPILLRPFYYCQINPLGLVDSTGLSREDIRKAYDEMMDFCTGRTATFSTGSLPWSQAGKAHFVDVRNLFLLDLCCAAAAGAILLGWAVLRPNVRVRPYRLRGRGFAFWGSMGLGLCFLIIGGLAALDFERAFLLFHALFFPGKDNWMFDPRRDAIINILPQAFFFHCAIFILTLILLMCLICILFDFQGQKDGS